MFILFDVIHERDRQTDRHCMTAKTALASHRAVKRKKERIVLSEIFTSELRIANAVAGPGRAEATASAAPVQQRPDVPLQHFISEMI